jgi:hypothetical protein
MGKVVGVHETGADGRAGIPARPKVPPLSPAETDGPLRLRSEVDQLKEALVSRAAIERAKGMLMIIYRYGEEAAFHTLATVSGRERRKLRDVAAEVVALAEPERIVDRLADKTTPLLPDRRNPARKGRRRPASATSRAVAHAQERSASSLPAQSSSAVSRSG